MYLICADAEAEDIVEVAADIFISEDLDAAMPAVVPVVKSTEVLVDLGLPVFVVMSRSPSSVIFF